MRCDAWRILFLIAALSTALPLAAQEVSLPLADYEALLDRARLPAQDPVPPAVPYVIESSEASVHVAAVRARVEQELVLSIFAPGWHRIEWPGRGRLVLSDFGDLEGRVSSSSVLASQDSDGASVVEEKFLMVRGTGRHRVRLVSVVPVEPGEGANPNQWRLAFDAPQAGVTRGTIETADPIESVRFVEGGAALGPAANRRTPFVATPGTTVKLQLEGRQLVPDPHQMALQFVATTASAMVVSRTRSLVHGWIRLEVSQGRMESFAVPLPAGFEVLAVEEKDLAGWDVVDGVLVGSLLEPLSGSLVAQLKLAGPVSSAFSSPLLVPQGAQRLRLYATVEVQGDALLRLTEEGSGRRLTPAEMHSDWGELEALLAAAQVRSPPILIHDPARPPAWEVMWPDGTEVLAAKVDHLLVDVLVGGSGRAGYQVWAQVRNSGAQRLGLKLPTGFQLGRAARDGQPVLPGIEGGRLALPLVAAAEPQTLHVHGLIDLAVTTGGSGFEVPLPELSAPASQVEVRVVAPPGAAYTIAGERRAHALERPTLAQRSTGVPQELFQRPPGYAEVLAAWTALSAQPRPLLVEAAPRTRNWEWF